MVDLAFTAHNRTHDVFTTASRLLTCNLSLSLLNQNNLPENQHKINT